MPPPLVIFMRAIQRVPQIVAGSLVLLCGVSNAQGVIGGSMAGQAINVTKEGASLACGYRVVVTSTNDGSGGRRMLDALLLLTKNGIVSRFDAKGLPRGVNGLDNLVPVNTSGGWFKVPGKLPAAPLAEIPEGVRRPPPTMSLVDTSGGVDVFDAIARGQPIQIGIRWEPEVESIYVGTVDIKRSMVDQFYACVKELGALLTKPKKDSNSDR